MQRKSTKELCSFGGTKVLAIALIGLAWSQLASADEVQMRNGDRYGGKVICLTNDVLLLHSEVLGKINLPKGQIRLILLGESSTNVVRQANTNRVKSGTSPVLNLNNPAEVTAAMRGLNSNADALQQVRNELLGQATPEATTKFNQLLSALMSGQMDIQDLRNEAKATADQVRALKSDLGEDAGWALDGYLAILDNFVNQSAPLPSGTNRAPQVKSP